MLLYKNQRLCCYVMISGEILNLFLQPVAVHDILFLFSVYFTSLYPLDSIIQSFQIMENLLGPFIRKSKDS